MTRKKIVSVVLTAAILFVGLGGCGIVPKSGMESSIGFSEPTSSAASVSLDRFEDENILYTELTREKLAEISFSGKTSDAVYWAMHFVTQNYKMLSPHSLIVQYIYYKDYAVSDYKLFEDQTEHRFYTHIFLIRFKTLGVPDGLSMDEEGYYNFELQLVMEKYDDNIKLLGYVTSQTNQITTEEDLVDFLNVIPEYKDMKAKSYPPKSTVPETGWFGEGPLINVAYTRASLSENPVTSNDDYYSTIKDWINLYIIGNYNAFSSLFNPSYSEISYTLETITGEKEHFSTLICETDFKSNMTPAGLKLYDGRYQIKFQMVVKTSEIYNEGPFTLIGFVSNQDRQIVEARELYDFIKGVPSYQDTDFIAPEPMKLIQLATLGYDFTEKKADDVSGLSVVNLRALTGGLKVDDFTFFPGDLLAILAVNPEVQNEKVLMVYKAEELRLLYQKTFSYPAGDYPTGGHVEFDNINGTPVLEHKLGEDNFKYFAPSQTGVSEISKPIARYRLSDTASIVDEKNCLYLEQNGVQKLLLEGIYEEDSTDWENYNFYCRISDTRFIYEKYGYEWYDECGIYDIETGEKTVFTHENAPLLNIVTYTDGKAILVADDWSDYDSYGPYLYNELTGELVDLDFLDIIPDESAIRPRFCLFGNTLAIFIEDNPFTTFSLYDVSSRLEIMHLNLFYARGYARNYSYYSNGLNATENYIWFNSTSEFPTDYLLRIPIKR